MLNVQPATIPAYGVFEGGGVKGAALAGAVAAAHQFGVRFRAVAGTSAGAVIAALYATGYREEFDIRNAMINMPLARFCDGFDSEPPESVIERALQFIVDRNVELRTLVPSLCGGMLGVGRGLLVQRNRQLLRDLGRALDGLVPLVERVINQWGIYNGDELVTWLEPVRNSRRG